MNLYDTAKGKGKLKLKGAYGNNKNNGNRNNISSGVNSGISSSSSSSGNSIGSKNNYDNNVKLDNLSKSKEIFYGDNDDGDNPPVIFSVINDISSDSIADNNKLSLSEDIEKIIGIGKISFSGNVGVGEGTRFIEQGIEQGDSIVIGDEKVTISVIFSERSLRVTSDIEVKESDFEIIKKPREKSQNKKRDRETLEKEPNFHAEEGSVDKVSQTFTYREKKPGAFGGYKTVTAKLEPGSSSSGLSSRTHLLDIRAKKKSDRHCM